MRLCCHRSVLTKLLALAQVLTNLLATAQTLKALILITSSWTCTPRADRTYVHVAEPCVNFEDSLGVRISNGISYRCQDGLCIDSTGRCNGIPNCRDGSDEEECPTPPFPSGRDAIVVGHGRTWRPRMIQKRSGPWRCWVPLWLHSKVKRLVLDYSLDPRIMCCPQGAEHAEWDCWGGSTVFSTSFCCGTNTTFPQRCLGVPFEWPAESDCATLDEMGAHFWLGHLFNGDKGSAIHDYLNTYESLLHLGPAARVLEFGILGGSSAAMWSQWFPSGRVIAMDVDLKEFHRSFHWLLARGANRSGNLVVLQTNATEDKSLLYLPEHEKYDLIVDDADHLSLSQITRFELYFPSRLTAGGYYIIEDVEEGIDHSGLATKYFRNLADHAQLKHAGVNYSTEMGAHLRDFRSKSSQWKDHVQWVLFQRTLIVIRKAWTHSGLPPQSRR